jgi:hypothetical protein
MRNREIEASVLVVNYIRYAPHNLDRLIGGASKYNVENVALNRVMFSADEQKVLQRNQCGGTAPRLMKSTSQQRPSRKAFNLADGGRRGVMEAKAWAVGMNVRLRNNSNSQAIGQASAASMAERMLS